MLLPALASARDKSKISVCINNLKQVGLAYNIYADDYDGFAPHASSDTVGNSWYRANATYQNKEWVKITPPGKLVRYQYLSHLTLQCPAIDIPDRLVGSVLYSYEMDKFQEGSSTYFFSSYFFKGTNLREKTSAWKTAYNDELNNNAAWGYRLGDYPGGLLACDRAKTSSYPTFSHKNILVALYEDGSVLNMKGITQHAYSHWSGSYGLLKGDQIFVFFRRISAKGEWAYFMN